MCRHTEASIADACILPFNQVHALTLTLNTRSSLAQPNNTHNIKPDRKVPSNKGPLYFQENCMLQ